MGLSHDKFVVQRAMLLEGLSKPTVDVKTALLVGTLLLIADELHRSNEENRGRAVEAECLRACIKDVATAVRLASGKAY